MGEKCLLLSSLDFDTAFLLDLGLYVHYVHYLLGQC